MVVTIGLSTITVPTPEPYIKNDPTKQVENLAYVGLQLLAQAKQQGVKVSYDDAGAGLPLDGVAQAVSGLTFGGVDFGTLPESVLTQIDQYFNALQTWLVTKPFDPSLSRGLTDALKPSVPVIISAILTAASGGTISIPVLLSAVVTQVGMGIIDSLMEQALARVDPKEETDHSDITQAIQDLQWNNEILDFGSFKIVFSHRMKAAVVA